MRSWPRFRAAPAVHAGVWLVFLLFTVLALFERQPSVAGRTTGGLLLLLFCIVYVGGFGCIDSVPESRRRLWFWAWFGAMVCIGAALFLLIDTSVMYMSPYFMAALVFNLRLRNALLIGVPLMALACWVIWLDNASLEAMTYVLGSVLVSSVIVIVVSVSARRERQATELEQRLALATQREDVARDVHDLLGHSLTVINLKSELAARLIDSDPEKARAELLEVSRLSRTAISEVRSTVTRLRQPDFPGAVEAARRALETAGIEADLPDASSSREIPGVNASLFSWALRETTTNIIRHSQATRCTVRLTPEKMQVSDDGLGIRSDPGNGLVGLRERVEKAGGALLLDRTASPEPSPDPDRPGTRVLVTMNGDPTPLETP